MTPLEHIYAINLMAGVKANLTHELNSHEASSTQLAKFQEAITDLALATLEGRVSDFSMKPDNYVFSFVKHHSSQKHVLHTFFESSSKLITFKMSRRRAKKKIGPLLVKLADPGVLRMALTVAPILPAELITFKLDLTSDLNPWVEPERRDEPNT